MLALGLTWDEDPVRQSDRRGIYIDAIAEFSNRGLTYPCFCSRKDIREASQAPNSPLEPGHYPGTCRTLSSAQLRGKVQAGRPPAIRVRSEQAQFEFVDQVCGSYSGAVDDFVIQRNDGTPAYNLAVVVDDDMQGVQEVVRGDDLLSSTPRQLFVAKALGLSAPAYAHVPLILAPNGKRLAKRDGAVTLQDRFALGESPSDVLAMLAQSVGFAEVGETVTLERLLERFEPALVPTQPHTLPEAYLG